uniref:HAT C-terminal dimerisation domain-containing protein n=1 Tax=Latimeria chalumnae TaxID=7897 RepID=H3AUL5_LATCH
VGKNNSLLVCFKAKNESIYINGRPCHVLHNAAQHVSKAFAEASVFFVQDFLVDLYYYFQGSTPRQVGAAEFAGFCDQEYQRVLKYASTRWLSMKLAVTRALKQYRSLKSYFDSQADKKSDLKLIKLKKYFHDPMTEVCLFFYQSVLPVFSNANSLQKENPQLHHMVDILESFERKLLGRFMCLDGFANIPLTEIDPMHHHLSDDKVMIGFSSRRLIQSNDILPVEEKTVVSAAKEFMVAAFRYSREHLPLTDVVAHLPEAVDFAKRATMDFSNFQFFVKNFETLHDRVGEDMDSLYNKFAHYHQLSDATIIKCANTSSVFDLELDSLWDISGQMKATNDILCFPLLFEVAKFVLLLPHSNASEERIFSIIQKNRTNFRPNLSLDKALPSILTCKINHLYHIPCHKFKPSNDLLCRVKAATNEYNTKHASFKW